MKRNILNILWSILLCLPLFSSCSEDNNGGDDLIWDFAPINFYMTVQDAEGNDLLSPTTEGNILNQDIKAIYKGKEYKLNELALPNTKAYLAILYGLHIVETEEGRCLLCFGELQGEDTYEDETITLDWGNGTTDVITFSSRLTWKSPEDPEFNRHFYLNGVEQKSSSFVLTKAPGTSPAWSRNTWRITDSNFYVYADNKADIQDDLQATPYQTGCGFRTDFPSSIISEGDKGRLTWIAANGWAIIGGALTVKQTVDFSEFTPDITDKYQSYPPDNQIYSYMEWEAELGEDVRCYDVFVVRSSQGGDVLWIYEDLTETYKKQFPKANVTKVVRTLVSEIYK